MTEQKSTKMVWNYESLLERGH